MRANLQKDLQLDSNYLISFKKLKVFEFDKLIKQLFFSI